MEFKDYYATLGVDRNADQDTIKRAYRKLARKFHPDVSKEPDAEARFKDVAEAYEALSDTERRAAYDDVGQRYRQGPEFTPPPGWESGFEFSGRDGGAAAGVDHSDFFESLFGRAARGRHGTHAATHSAGEDHHAKVQIDLLDAYRGGQRSVSLRTPQADAQGHVTLHTRQIDVQIPKGIRDGQLLRLSGQGGPGHGGGPAGDLYLQIHIAPDRRFRVDGKDVYLDLPLAPWEAALGASVTVPTPDGSVELGIPAGSVAGRKLRLKGKGLPATPPGDLYAVLTIALPPAPVQAAQDAYRALAAAFPDFDARRAREA